MSAAPTSLQLQAHWSAVIHKTLLMHAVSLELLPYGETSSAKLPKECHDVIGPLCKELLGQWQQLEIDPYPAQALKPSSPNSTSAQRSLQTSALPSPRRSRS